MTFDNYFQTLIPMLLLACVFWLISLLKKDVSIVDSLWSVFFIVGCFASYLQLDAPGLRAQIVMLLVIIWGLRLSLYITLRHWGHEEDHRYQQIRKNNQPYFKLKSLYLIFIFQALLAWIISLPIFFAIHSTTEELGYLDWLGIVLWLTGMYFETVADYQLWKFKRNRDNAGKIYTDGLWSYTRHPNYFGEFLIWWGYFSLSLAAGGVALLSVISPLIMSFLLMKFSGVALLEKTMKKRPGYETYMHNTNAFFPAFSKWSDNHPDKKKSQS